MKKCTELAKFGNKSVVEVRRTDTDAVVQYVVCSNFNNSKAFGSKWDWGHYFEVWENNVAEIQLRNAMLYLYGIDESEILFDRAKELLKKLLEMLRYSEDEDEEDLKESLQNLNITEVEAEFLGVKDLLFQKKYKVVDVTLERKQRVTVKVVMPDDEDECNAEDYVENYEYLEDNPNVENDDWECDDYSIDRNDLSAEDYERMYDRDEIWNDCEFENL